MDTLALFTVLLPSLEHTLDCGFNYVTIVGYDEGDAYFDREAGQKEVSRASRMRLVAQGWEGFFPLWRVRIMRGESCNWQVRPGIGM